MKTLTEPTASAPAPPRPKCRRCHRIVWGTPPPCGRCIYCAGAASRGMLGGGSPDPECPVGEIDSHIWAPERNVETDLWLEQGYRR